MELSQNLPSGVFNALLALTTLICFAGSARSTRIVIQNNCSHTVWAAANPGGGKELRQGDTWTLPNVTGRGRIWGRTNCAGFGPDGRGGFCESGDCGGRLECETDGRAPNTVAEYSVGDRETDGFYISVVEGFNIPMEFGASPSSTEVCPQATRCAADVNAPCPMELRDPGGCNNPCTVFQNNQFCCTSTGSSTSCGPTSYSKFFEDLCPAAATYPNDINAKRSTCQTGIEYSVMFCPSETESASSTQLYNPVFEIQNNCSYPVWAAAIPGGSKRLDSGESWFTNRDKGTAGGARIWGRTNCSFDAAGRGKCETGDCGGLLECKGYSKKPVTLAEYALNQLSNLDFFDISLVDGFNLPMEFVPTSNGCVRGPRCAADLSRECPKVLRAPGGCHNPCTVFKTAEYCCFIGTTCGPTSFSRYFKDRCPDSYSYPRDDLASTFTCPGGTYYKIVFCP